MEVIKTVIYISSELIEQRVKICYSHSSILWPLKRQNYVDFKLATQNFYLKVKNHSETCKTFKAFLSSATLVVALSFKRRSVDVLYDLKEP